MVLTMFGHFSYRNFITTVVEVLLITTLLALPVKSANADNGFQAQRENMIRLIETDVRATSAYLKRAARRTRARGIGQRAAA